MPSSRDKDADVDDRVREKRHRPKSERKDRDRDREKERDKDRDRERERDREHRERDRERDSIDRDRDSSTSHRHHHRSSRSSKLRPTGSDNSRSHRHHRIREMEKEDEPQYRAAASSSMTDLVPELRRGLGSDRGSVPYPSFSKAHSREDVSAGARRTDPLTPEATDLGGSEMRRSKSADSPGATRKPSPTRKETRKDDRPPSPPETDLSAQKKRPEVVPERSHTPISVKEERAEDERPGSRDSDSQLSSRISRSTSKQGPKSKVSKVSAASSQRTFILPAHIPPRVGKPRTTAMSEVTDASTVDSGATSVLPPKRSFSSAAMRPPPPPPPPMMMMGADSSPESAADSSSPKTPQTMPYPPPPPPLVHGMVHGEKHPMSGSDVPTPIATPAPGGPLPPPPPPPPPMPNMQEVPRVDYLMQNGGLPQPVTRAFLSVLPRQNGTRPSNPPLMGADTLFAPFFNLLNQYSTVLSGHGSIAVATGHRTVARRLLDRLENVFSRDLSAEGCPCVMCETNNEDRRGLGWGEVLEQVSGRIDLPQWPPFDLGSLSNKAAEDIAEIPARPPSPIKMDPDIAEEFREHYLRQTKRVKAAVDRWMASCDRAPAPPREEVDDETLTFAILTNLDSDDRPYFNALLSGSRDLHPATRAPTPFRRPRNDFLVKTGLSLQRLYRLPQAPRDAETAVYLVKNPEMHDLLHTITEINPSEWEILTSGRFDGFLWSGVEDDPPLFGTSARGTPASGIIPKRDMMSPAGGLRGLASRGPTPFRGSFSRGPTPANGGSPYSRGPTPASFVSGVSAASSSYPSRTAVSHDEETEIAVLAELEREIFNGMEALEDAFEKLHEQAMSVRDALRRRGAALSMSLQQRRGALGISVLPLSGSSGIYDAPAWADDESTDGALSDWGGDELSELAPDDSASQISSNRHRKVKRRRERATPAPIEEEDEM
ncbi:hypothetical protein QBC47DRAFT_294969 [Echria macrotheca]|uniref:5-Methylcytosine G/T mismatch-specific DNA glycosylase n=1 Tax=Echria macrotheca TaxID=438768 RepID=A0AAJ0FE67_9PEZI|nr:hypothetical protein QBC47DRAFT_294969 [Echria macrotheca]